MWTGEDCGTQTCPSGRYSAGNKLVVDACNDHGTCREGAKGSPPKCECQKGYSGDACEELSCDWDPVKNIALPGCHEDIKQGVCHHGKCFCNNNFTGKWCEQHACKQCDAIDKCPNRCSGRGVCHNGKCSCQS